jgi:cytochrome c551/c552
MKSSLVFFALLTTVVLHAAPPVEEGKTIFTSRCAGCHNVNKQVVGPALAGVDQRRSLDWIVNFVHSSQTVIQKGDKDAVALFKQFNNIPMPDHKDLSEAQITNLVEYIKLEAQQANAAKAPVTDPKQPSPGLLQVILKSPGLVFTFSVLALLLASVLYFAFRVKQYRHSLDTVK